MKHQFRQFKLTQDNEYSSQGSFVWDKASSLVEQDTLKQVATKPDDPILYRVLNNLPKPVQDVITTIHARVLDPQPEHLSTRGLEEGKRGTALGLFPIITFVNALGLLLVSLSYYISRYGNNALEVSFLSGLLLMFVPGMVRLLSPAPSRLERICLL